MFTTLELRWFYRGTSPTEVEQWFSTDCPGELLGVPEEREDVYLYVPDCSYLNIKVRQGSLEVKWRKKELGIRQFSNSWEGNVETWLKWLCDDPAQESFIPKTSIEKKPWVRVKKVRSQRHYEGITCELTQLYINTDTWWTVAFEGDVEEVSPDSFDRVVSEMGKTYRGLELLADQSYAYPNWISLVK
ncbi:MULTISPECIES: hypothetical protein [unclassified Coleofasciculus]|uniref:hypothetical protein n=1 Tax=unclassified Coleofasciculus TaxID=2692782 RepID=UPI001882CAE1|nr:MULTISPECIES: hypothetical protein [unclassified Coleofasciculus]MBE9127532.1 hypothetical protein [Coleofasciculus sp. LEGE 07081]MBE9150883.1 hypothetical protein [Coleofasciculus sp. LEGE 07092]